MTYSDAPVHHTNDAVQQPTDTMRSGAENHAMREVNDTRMAAGNSSGQDNPGLRGDSRGATSTADKHLPGLELTDSSKNPASSPEGGQHNAGSAMHTRQNYGERFPVQKEMRDMDKIDSGTDSKQNSPQPEAPKPEAPLPEGSKPETPKPETPLPAQPQNQNVPMS